MIAEFGEQSVESKDVVRCIKYNPVKAKLVERVENWRFSSVRERQHLAGTGCLEGNAG